MPPIEYCRSDPTEVAVLGVDNDRLICELSEPKLSSIIPDTKRTGYEAARLLDRVMSGEAIAADSPLITQPLGIRVRESTDTVASERFDSLAEILREMNRIFMQAQIFGDFAIPFEWPNSCD